MKTWLYMEQNQVCITDGRCYLDANYSHKNIASMPLLDNQLHKNFNLQILWFIVGVNIFREFYWISFSSFLWYWRIEIVCLIKLKRISLRFYRFFCCCVKLRSILIIIIIIIYFIITNRVLKLHVVDANYWTYLRLKCFFRINII